MFDDLGDGRYIGWSMFYFGVCVGRKEIVDLLYWISVGVWGWMVGKSWIGAVERERGFGMCSVNWKIEIDWFD